MRWYNDAHGGSCMRSEKCEIYGNKRGWAPNTPNYTRLDPKGSDEGSLAQKWPRGRIQDKPSVPHPRCGWTNHSRRNREILELGNVRWSAP